MTTSHSRRRYWLAALLAPLVAPVVAFALTPLLYLIQPFAEPSWFTFGPFFFAEWFAIYSIPLAYLEMLLLAIPVALASRPMNPRLFALGGGGIGWVLFLAGASIAPKPSIDSFVNALLLRGADVPKICLLFVLCGLSVAWMFTRIALYRPGTS
jgi:hypothetical protein